MTRTNTTRWYSPVGVMTQAGSTYAPIGTFYLNLHIGGRGRTSSAKLRKCVSRYWPKADIPNCTAHVRFRGQSGHRLLRCKCPLMTEADIDAPSSALVFASTMPCH
jgi:hypothetical protein